MRYTGNNRSYYNCSGHLSSGVSVAKPSATLLTLFGAERKKTSLGGFEFCNENKDSTIKLLAAAEARSGG